MDAELRRYLQAGLVLLTLNLGVSLASYQGAFLGINMVGGLVAAGVVSALVYFGFIIGTQNPPERPSE